MTTDERRTATFLIIKSDIFINLKMQIKTLLYLVPFLLVSSCTNGLKTPVEVLTLSFGDTQVELGQSGYHITISENYLIKKDSSVTQRNTYRFYKPGNEFISFAIITLEDKGKTKYELDPFLDKTNPIKIIQSVILGKTYDWKVYKTGVLGYTGILSGNISSLVCSPDLRSIDSLISIVSSVSK
jgi:hypothetical protein